MCLQKAIPVKEKSGIGYKVVIKKGEGCYTSYWPYFKEDGGVYGVTNIRGQKLYKLNKKATVTHKRVTKTVIFSNPSAAAVEYLAWIHIYKTLSAAEKELSGWYREPNTVIIKCKYFRATVEDDTCIVAKEIIPIEEL